jgi:glycosyltransferase involved in cell wall biosynthesis
MRFPAEKVAIQLISTGGYYGAERALVELAAYLHEQGWRSHVVALEGQGAGEVVQRAAERGVSAEAFVTSGRLGLRSMLSKLRQLLTQYPGAILHSHGYKPDILLALTRVPTRFACLATCHNWISETPKLRFLEALDKRALRAFAHVVAVSDEIASELIRSGVSRDSVSVIDNGIAVAPADPGARARIRAEFALSAEQKVILHVGRLARSKRIDLLLRAVSTLPRELRATLLLVGEGEEQQRLSDMVHKLRLDGSVHFCGYRRDVAQLLAAADVFALSSEREGLPISMLEAMAAGCPIVATRVGAIPRVLEDGRDGWILPVNDSGALRHALNEALGNPELARARARNAAGKFAAGYSQESMGARYLELYERAQGVRSENVIP